MLYYVSQNVYGTKKLSDLFVCFFSFLVEMEQLNVLQKQEKVLERCKYWPACKNGDECMYHHPTQPCK